MKCRESQGTLYICIYDKNFLKILIQLYIELHIPTYLLIHSNTLHFSHTLEDSNLRQAMDKIIFLI